MSESVRIDPVEVRMGADDAASATHDAAAGFAGHETELSEAASGWIGSSLQALGEVSAAWHAQHAADQARVTRLSQVMAEAAVRYTTTDEGASAAVDEVAAAMGI